MLPTLNEWPETTKEEAEADFKAAEVAGQAVEAEEVTKVLVKEPIPPQQSSKKKYLHHMCKVRPKLLPMPQ